VCIFIFSNFVISAQVVIIHQYFKPKSGNIQNMKFKNLKKKLKHPFVL